MFHWIWSLNIDSKKKKKLNDFGFIKFFDVVSLCEDENEKRFFQLNRSSLQYIKKIEINLHIHYVTLAFKISTTMYLTKYIQEL